MMTSFTEYLTDVFEMVPMFGLLLGFFIGVVYLIKKLLKSGIANAGDPIIADVQLTGADNVAFAVLFGAFFWSLADAMSGATFGTGLNFQVDAIDVLVGCVAALVLNIGTFLIVDKFGLSKFSVWKEILTDKNVGTALVLGGAFVANGRILNGVMSGESDGLLMSFRDIIVYWGVGQLFILVCIRLYQAITKYDIHKVIADDDSPMVGLVMGAFIAAEGIVLRGALYRASGNIGEELPTVILAGLMGLLLLVAGRVIADKVFLPKSPLAHEIVKDRNLGAAIIAAVVFIAIAGFYSNVTTSSIDTFARDSLVAAADPNQVVVESIEAVPGVDVDSVPDAPTTETN